MNVLKPRSDLSIEIIIVLKNSINENTYLKTRNRITVISIAITEMDTPTYPMILRDKVTIGSSVMIGLALRRIPK